MPHIIHSDGRKLTVYFNENTRLIIKEKALFSSAIKSDLQTNLPVEKTLRIQFFMTYEHIANKLKT